MMIFRDCRICYIDDFMKILR